MENSLVITTQFFLSAVMIHLITCRFSSSRFMFKGLILGVITVISFAFFQFRAGKVDLVSLYLLGTAWLGYLMFFINLLNSVTLKMLAALSESKNETLLNSDFNSFFSEENGLHSRISLMIENGFLETKGNGLILTPRSKLMVWCINLLRKVFAMENESQE
ncbi:MAG: hypothetical protein ACJAT2_000990 [Bacteriovoracaceae bacterium]|jgi:hypothetical protein